MYMSQLMSGNLAMANFTQCIPRTNDRLLRGFGLYIRRLFDTRIHPRTIGVNGLVEQTV